MRRRSSLLLGYAATAAVDTWLASQARPAAHRLRYLTKPALMPLLLAARRASDAEAAQPAPGRSGTPAALTPRQRRLRTAVAGAQLTSWGGDVALLLPGTGAFRTGLSSFALAHVAYVAGLAEPVPPGRLVADPRVRGILGAGVASLPIMTIAAQRRSGLGKPVAVYAALLTGMAIAAQSPTLAAGEGKSTVSADGRRLLSVGSLLFLTSDSLLGTKRFVLAAPPAILEGAVMATYTAGQLLLEEGAHRA